MFLPHRSLRILCSSLAGGLFLSPPLSAQVFVDVGATPGGDGSSWASAFADLQPALSAAAALPPGVEVWVAAGSYRPSDSADKLATFQLTNGVAIYGGFAGGETTLAQRDPVVNVTVLDGDLSGDDQPFCDLDLDGTPDYCNYADNSVHVVTGTGADFSARLDGFTIRGGTGPLFGFDPSGSGLFVEGGSPTLANLVFRENRALDANGIAAGAYIQPDQPMFLQNLRFEANRAVTGGGLVLELDAGAAIPVGLDGCVFENNIATGGAGLFVEGVEATCLDCTFVSNQATSGSAARVRASSINPSLPGLLTLSQCTVESNLGEAVQVQTGSHLVVEGSRLAFNQEGAIDAHEAKSVDVRDSDFEGNTATVGAGINASGVGEITVSGSTFVAQSATNGSAVSLGSSTGTISGCTMVAGIGAAVWASSSSLVVQHCRIEGNANPGGIGFGASGVHSASSVVDVLDSVFLENAGGHVSTGPSSILRVRRCTTLNQNLLDAGVNVSLGGLILLNDSIIWGSGEQIGGPASSVVANYCNLRTGLAVPGIGNLNVDPLFVDSLSGDLSLQPGSPCIEAADPGELPVGLDIDGDSRILDGDLNGQLALDMGADEVAPIHLAISGSTAVGSTLTFDTTGSPGLPAVMGIGRPGELFVPPFGVLVADPFGTPFFLLSWPTTPSSVPLTVPAGLSGTLVFQEVALAPGAGTVSNGVALEF